MPKEQKKKKKKGKRKREREGAPVQDERFAHIHHDPRFTRIPSKKNKVAVDERFAGMFEEKRFAQPDVDKYGRRVAPPSSEEAESSDLRRFYTEGDDGSDSDSGGVAEAGVGAGASAVPVLGSDDDEGADASGSDDDAPQPEWADDLEQEDEQVEWGEAHRRLAVLDCEWSRMSAVDILAIVRCFVPPGGSIADVTVFPSKIGMEAMAKEERHGPQLEGVVPTPVDESAPNDDGDGGSGEYQEYDPEVLRKYELGKLKWYFAVVTCDSVATAEHVYKECDGLEYERSGLNFDFRYIADDVQFDQAPRDSATDVPLNYKQPMFSNKATSSSKVELTWDQDDPDRFKLRKKKFTKDDINEHDLQAYLASDSEDEQEGQPGRDGRDKLRALLEQPAEAAAEGDSDGGSDDEKPDEDMVITFDSGLAQAGRDILESKRKREKEDSETTWEAYLRKRQEKKAAKKAARKKSALANRGVEETEDLGFDDPFFQTNDAKAGADEKDPFEDPFFESNGSLEEAEEAEAGGKKKKKLSKKEKRKQEKEERKREKARQRERQQGREEEDSDDPIAKARAAKEQAELELIVGEEPEGTASSFDMKHVDVGKKKKRRKKKKRSADGAEGAGDKRGDDGFRIDTGDERFAAIFENHKYAIDPTDAKFKATPAMQQVMDERQRRRKQKRPKGAAKAARAPESKGDDIAQLVASVKRKAR